MEKYFLIKKYFSTFFPLFLLFSLQKHYYFYKKPEIRKKIFCFNFLSMSTSSAKCFHIWFDISKVTSVEKRELRKHFSALACSFLGLGLRPRLQKPFPQFPFFYFSNLEKTKIRQGQIFPQSSQHNYWNKILFFVMTLQGFCNIAIFSQRA